ncbi:MAG: hypothetical protein OEW35_03940 [Gammaproteobacteria bacterium]|nr:hypothetical protein [Gammaproteobacteria bacterium]MDH4253508.1 hypothetical protein [Gammaproteobacteria bacterium]MDH5309741.1 hypothetical protein [Gammaproteobacteria bacterium]
MHKSLLIPVSLFTVLLLASRPGPALTLEEFEEERDPIATQSGGGAGESDPAAESETVPEDLVSDDPFSRNYPTLDCAACRDPMTYSVDFGNAAWNAIWGPKGSLDLWHDLAPGGMLKVVNAEGQYALVWFSDYLHVLGTPTNTMLIKVRLPNGQVFEYSVLRIGIELLVGADGGDTAAPGPDSDGADGEDDPEWSDAADYEYEEPEPPRGTVEIVDPDDYGEYPDWMEEL